jgi:hypothetical protein
MGKIYAPGFCPPGVWYQRMGRGGIHLLVESERNPESEKKVLLP